MSEQESNARAVAAAMFANGGFEAKLRLPGEAIANDAAEELGLVAPEFQDVPLGPAVWRKAGVDKELMVSGAAVDALVGSLDFVSAESLLTTAVGVLVSGVLYGISGSSPVMMGCAPGAFRLALQAPEGGRTAA